MPVRSQPTSNFVTVKCDECGNEQTVFDKPAGNVKCLVCDEVLIETTGGRGIIVAKRLDG